MLTIAAAKAAAKSFQQIQVLRLAGSSQSTKMQN
jgi:hypothetical protein